MMSGRRVSGDPESRGTVENGADEMEKRAQIEQLLVRSHRLAALVITLTLAVLAATIFFTTRQLRATIREQIAGRDGETLHGVVLMQQDAEAAEVALEGSLADPADQLTVALVASQLKGVMGARLFDANGKFVMPFPANVREAEINRNDLKRLRLLKPASHFRESVVPSALFYPEEDAPAFEQPIPVLEVNVPLHTKADDRLVGIAQFLIEGQSLAAEFARLDRRLFFQALAAFSVAGAILAITIGWAFRTLRRAQRLLAERTTNLLQANQELALAAKTSAVGAVTAHLIHGLKSPLTGLQNFMAGLTSGDGERADSHWHEAVASTRRMHMMINQVVNVLREEEGNHRYEITLSELAQIVSGRVESLSCKQDVRFVTRVEGGAILPNRTANLTALILINLVQNGLQATPAGKSVTLNLAGEGDQITFQVRDEGPGFSEVLRQNLFTPCQSTKEGGCGIGLAISKQLANHLGAELELIASTPAGCVFALTLPVNAAAEKSVRAVPTPVG